MSNAAPFPCTRHHASLLLLALALTTTAGGALAAAPSAPAHSVSSSAVHQMRIDVARALAQQARPYDRSRSANALHATTSMHMQLPQELDAFITEQDRLIRRAKGLPEGRGLLRLETPEGAMPMQEALEHPALRIATEGDDDQRSEGNLVAFDRQGTQHLLSSRTLAGEPVVVLRMDTRQAMREGMAVVNDTLRGMHLQPAQSTATAPADFTRLDSIHLDFDHEPDTKGAAEVFAVISGFQTANDKPTVSTLEMPWLDHDKRTYTPGQAVIVWDGYRFDAANIQLFEDDGDTNYKALAEALGNAATLAVNATAPEFSAIPLIANAIIKAIPDYAFTDDNDYMDSFYVIERGRTYRDLKGAAGNATVTLTPHTFGRRDDTGK